MLKWRAKVYKGLIVSRGAVNDCTSRDVPIEKIGANTEFKLSFTIPSIEELASSF